MTAMYGPLTTGTPEPETPLSERMPRPRMPDTPYVTKLDGEVARVFMSRLEDCMDWHTYRKEWIYTSTGTLQTVPTVEFHMHDELVVWHVDNPNHPVTVVMTSEAYQGHNNFKCGESIFALGELRHAKDL